MWKKKYRKNDIIEYKNILTKLLKEKLFIQNVDIEVIEDFISSNKLIKKEDDINYIYVQILSEELNLYNFQKFHYFYIIPEDYNDIKKIMIEQLNMKIDYYKKLLKLKDISFLF